jgi:hypothetical protein
MVLPRPETNADIDIPLASLVAFHGGSKQAKDRYARLRAALEQGDQKAARAALKSPIVILEHYAARMSGAKPVTRRQT